MKHEIETKLALAIGRLRIAFARQEGAAEIVRLTEEVARLQEELISCGK